MYVTLDIFSGRPNPGWRLKAKDARRLNELVASAPRTSAAAPDRLGFRGFVVEREPGDPPPPPAQPRRFRVAPRPSDDALPSVDDPDAVDLLLKEAGGACEPQVAEITRAAAAEPDERESGARPSVDARWQSFVPRAIAAPERGLALTSAFRPAFWNRPTIRLNNNCYNYASNFASNTVAQPGRRTGHLYDGLACTAVAEAAMADGVLPALTTVARVVALAIWPGVDFHFWRLHPGGLWAHKLGLSTARSYDNFGRTIVGGVTPETCARAPYTDFCGYFYVPLGMPVR